MKRIFIECTCTHNSDVNTGIQRVVRNLTRSLVQLETDKIKIIPIQSVHGLFETIDKNHLFNPTNDLPELEGGVIYLSLKKLFYWGRFSLAVLMPRNLKAYLKSPFYVHGSLANQVHRIMLKFKFFRSILLKNNYRFQPGDIILLPDSWWSVNLWYQLRKAKRQGAIIISIVYDIIPFTHPQFFDELLVRAFQKWLIKSVSYVDAYVAISKCVMMDLQNLFQQLKLKTTKTKFAYYHNGADLVNINNLDIRVNKLDSIFKNGLPTFLTVCTLEPRKNHSQILAAATNLWQNDNQFNLVFIGKKGWKIDSFVQKMRAHDEFDKKFFWLSNINDAELIYAYKNSTALVYASIAEGFGLPIVEAKVNGLRVLASDIPVHREVGMDGIEYFKLQDSDDLANCMKKVLDGQPAPAGHCVEPLTWNQSAKQLLDVISKL